MGQNTSLDQKGKKYEPHCPPLDRQALLGITPKGECQGCHETYEIHHIGPCPFCNFNGDNTNEITG